MPRKLPRRLGSLPRHPPLVPPAAPLSYCSSSRHVMPTQPSACRQATESNFNSASQTIHLPSMKHTATYSNLMAYSPTFFSIARSSTKCPALVSHTSCNVKSPFTPPNSPTESFPSLSYSPRGQLLPAGLNKIHFDPRKGI